MKHDLYETVSARIIAELERIAECGSPRLAPSTTGQHCNPNRAGSLLHCTAYSRPRLLTMV
jgi:hypothetical protein